MMISNKLRYFILSIFLILYGLFFCIYNVKALSSTTPPQYLDYYYWNGNSGVGQSPYTNEFTTTTIIDKTFYYPKNVDNFMHPYYMVSATVNNTVAHGSNFSFLIATTNYLSNLKANLLFNNTCQVLTPINSDNAPIYVYIARCELDNSVNSYGFSFEWDKPTDDFAVESIMVSDLYMFNDMTELDEFIAVVQRDLTDAEEDGSLDQTANNILQAINSSHIDASNFSSTIGSWTPSFNNNPISNLITLPIIFLNGVSSAISGTCDTVNYISLYDYQVTLPCLNLSQRLGSVWVVIDTIFSLMLIYSIGKSLVKTFARLSDMDTNIMYECYSEGITGRSKDING